MHTNLSSLAIHMTISEILDRWPEFIPVFLKHKMACVGCSMADFMTLEDALEIYKINQETFIGELNKTIQTRKSEAD